MNSWFSVLSQAQTQNSTRKTLAPETCPNCGAEVPPGAKVCPECGSDDQTGWSDQARNDALNLPEEHFDHEDFVQREFGGKKPIPRGMHWFWWVMAVLTLAALAWLWWR